MDQQEIFTLFAVGSKWSSGVLVAEEVIREEDLRSLERMGYIEPMPDEDYQVTEKGCKMLMHLINCAN